MISSGIQPGHLPRHIAIIMDGNGRWAKKRGLPRTAGHAAGAETFRRIATYCKDIGLPYLTVYAFSSENWSRPENEVRAIMGLLERYLKEAIERMERDGVRMAFFGDLTPLSQPLKELIARTSEISARYEGPQVNICLNYGGRGEIVRAAQECARIYAQTGVMPDEAAICANLWSAGVPDPDLIIRPGGEQRLSNFLLWQAAYAELYFTDVLWPDFTTAELDKAIAVFSGRERRYGGVGEEKQ